MPKASNFCRGSSSLLGAKERSRDGGSDAADAGPTAVAGAYACMIKLSLPTFSASPTFATSNRAVGAPRLTAPLCMHRCRVRAAMGSRRRALSSDRAAWCLMQRLQPGGRPANRLAAGCVWGRAASACFEALQLEQKQQKQQQHHL